MDNIARFIDDYVDLQDFEALNFRHARAADTGRPPYHPGDLLKLYIYRDSTGFEPAAVWRGKPIETWR